MEYLLRMIECRAAVFAVGFIFGGGLGYLAALDWLRSIRKDEEQMSKAYSEVPRGRHEGGAYSRVIPVSADPRGPANKAELRRRIDYWKRRKEEDPADVKTIAICERAIDRLQSRLDQATGEGMG